MGDTKTTLWNEIVQGVGKGLVWIAYISIGVIAKLAFDSRSNKLTTRQIIIKTVLSIFVGVLAAIVCENLHYDMWGKVIVPVSTLIGEGVIVYVMSNWKKILINWLPSWAQKIVTKK